MSTYKELPAKHCTARHPKILIVLLISKNSKSAVKEIRQLYSMVYMTQVIKAKEFDLLFYLIALTHFCFHPSRLSFILTKHFFTNSLY